ncbi:hypothetical protein GCM10025864_09430 [Luteimicrobium album]|uniref:Carbohydrate kinase PfkB domain-containing protein n=1 Tax=Luteimicrobium album TaxID=1054550 RepID=A0ABQ6HXE7_9MICO|nr:PfkB family carbohydrate kinase [Luteimicrobium album]GMA23184.1 hypothetical protein GCM10025864_09430 [Luteimicrobium album]
MVGVVVVGSTNIDLVVTAPRRPGPGETVLGDGFVEVVGGKGLNQALGAAAAGPTAFVGAVGRDEPGRRARARLAAAGVAAGYLAETTAPTGRALITLTPDGENSIIVAPLANDLVDGPVVVHALDELRPAVVLTQLEIPLSAVEAAAGWCVAHGVRLILNASPARVLPSELLAVADPLIVNAHEGSASLGEGTATIHTRSCARWPA